MERMRPVLGSATTTLPLKLPSASMAAARTSRSSPMGLSPAAGSPKELTCQGLQTAVDLRWRLWLVCGVVVCAETEVACAVAGFFLLTVAALRAPPRGEKNRLTSARKARFLLKILPPSSVEFYSPASSGANQPRSLTSLPSVPPGRHLQQPTPPQREDSA